MSNKMLSFVDTDKEMPAKREADARVGDFAEIYDEFDKGTAERSIALFAVWRALLPD